MTLLERLRVETRPAHDRIERRIDLKGRMSSPSGYLAVLERLYGFHSVWEVAAEPWIADPEFFDPRRKTALLLRDLAQLGLSQPAVACLPACGSVMPFSCPATAYGSMYVIEGSTLGGAVISRHVERALNLSAGAGSAYFRSYGSATGSMWRAFRERLLSISTPAADGMIVASAQRTFALMEGWLCGPDSVAA